MKARVTRLVFCCAALTGTVVITPAMAGVDRDARTLALVEVMSEACFQADMLDADTRQAIKLDVRYLRKLNRVAGKPYQSHVAALNREYTADPVDCRQMTAVVSDLEQEISSTETHLVADQLNRYFTPDAPMDYDTMRILRTTTP